MLKSHNLKGDKKLSELEEKVEKLQGIETKRLYDKLGNLKKDVERITKLMDFNIANSEDAETQELQKINTKIEIRIYVLLLKTQREVGEVICTCF